jgi:hypothetical protein
MTDVSVLILDIIKWVSLIIAAFFIAVAFYARHKKLQK